MTNLQDGASRLSGTTIRRIWLLLPAAFLGGIGLLVVLAALVPLWNALQQDSRRVQELEQMREQVLMLRGQVATSREDTQKAVASKAKIIRLITGNGDLSTFLAILDREAREAGVKLTRYEPTEVAAPAPNQGAPPAPAPAPPAQGAAPAPPPAAGVTGSLAQEGLTQRTLIVSARGRFQSLLAFLRRLEGLNVLVFQSDLKLNLAEENAANGKATQADAPVVMNLTLGLYSRKAGGAPAAATPAAAAAPVGVPPAAAAPAPPPSAATPPATTPPAATPPAEAPPAAPAAPTPQQPPS
jgi:type IV pilus assembly protein PilO